MGSANLGDIEASGYTRGQRVLLRIATKIEAGKLDDALSLPFLLGCE